MTNYKILGYCGEDSKEIPVFIDECSILHFLFGYVGILNLNYFKINQVYSVLLLFVIHTIYEIKDYYFSYVYKGKQNLFTKKSAGNSLLNCIGDTLVFILGIILGINTYHTFNTMTTINNLYILFSAVSIYFILSD